tara:strand:- start:468 stop:629 length:162 start_codon:yes stop_codon:yes gene_type:complete
MKYDPEEFQHVVETMLDDHNQNFQKLLIEIVKLEGRIRTMELRHLEGSFNQKE